MPNSTLWDGREPITLAMERFALRDAFQVALDGNDRLEVVRILCNVGADAETACQMVAMLIPEPENEPA